MRVSVCVCVCDDLNPKRVCSRPLGIKIPTIPYQYKTNTEVNIRKDMAR